MIRIIVQLGRSRIILAFIIGLGLIAGYLGYSNLDAPILVEEGPPIRGDSLESFKGFSLDFSILDDERYKALEIFGENPVDIGITGELKNPFTPL